MYFKLGAWIATVRLFTLHFRRAPRKLLFPIPSIHARCTEAKTKHRDGKEGENIDIGVYAQGALKKFLASGRGKVKRFKSARGEKVAARRLGPGACEKREREIKKSSEQRGNQTVSRLAKLRWSHLFVRGRARNTL